MEDYELYYYNRCLIISLIILNLFDFLSTVILFKMNFIETNDFLRNMLENNEYAPLIIYKVIVVSGVLLIFFYLYRYVEANYQTNKIITSMQYITLVILGFLFLAYVLVLINNISIISGGNGLEWLLK